MKQRLMSKRSIFVANEIKTLKQLPPGWDGISIPYGAGDGNTRLQDLLPSQ